MTRSMFMLTFRVRDADGTVAKTFTQNVNAYHDPLERIVTGLIGFYTLCFGSDKKISCTAVPI